MTFQEWEVPTPPEEQNNKLGDSKDLFSIDPQKKAKQKTHVEAYYKDLLQLDSE